MVSAGARLADTADLAFWLLGIALLFALIGGAINLRLAVRWRVLKTWGLRRLNG